MNPLLSVLAFAMFGVFTWFIFHDLHPFSCFTLLTMYLLWKLTRTGRLRWALLCGVGLGLALLAKYSDLSAVRGGTHACGLDGSGQAWCWGNNRDGELGNASNSLGWMVPVPVWAPGS